MVLTAAAPTVTDAQQAADALAQAGAGRVVLFGSVAREEATERSDIDLIAIYDDIDYSRRREIAESLEATAAGAAGFPVNVLVTDRPEWGMRTTGVHTSLESRAARSGRLLVDRPVGKVNWRKEMVMPTDDYHEGLYRLGHVVTALGRVNAHLKPGLLEGFHAELGNVEGAVLAEIDRMLALGGAAHSVIEHSVKALIHRTAHPETQPWGHRIETLCPQLPGPMRRHVVTRLLHPLSPRSITPWSALERYHRPGEDPDPGPSLVESLIGAATRVALYTAGHFGTAGRAPDVRLHIDFITNYLNTYDLRTEQALPPPEPKALSIDL